MSRTAKDTIEGLRTGFQRDAEGLRAFALEALCELTQSAGALWYQFGLLAGEPVPVRWQLRGADEVLMRPRVEQRIGWPHADPRVPAERWNRSFVTLRQVMDVETELWPSQLYRQCHEPAGVHDVLRLVVYHDGCFLGWIGALRGRGEARFSRADVRRVAPLAASLADALVRAEHIERPASDEGGGDLVVTCDGAVELASSAARELLGSAERRAGLRAWVGELDGGGAAPEILFGHRVRSARLSGPDGPRYLLHLEPTPRLRLHPSYVLSRAQREVGTLAAAGATATEIADMIDVAPSTVKTHLRQVYVRLHVASRAELALALDDLPRAAAR